MTIITEPKELWGNKIFVMAIVVGVLCICLMFLSCCIYKTFMRPNKINNINVMEPQNKEKKKGNQDAPATERQNLI